MKIIQVCPRFFPYVGGVETNVLEISRELSKNHDVFIYTTDPTGKLPQNEDIDGIKIKRFQSIAPNESYFFSPGIYSALKKESCDVLHCHSYHAFPALEALFSRPNIKKFLFTPYFHGEGHTKFRNFFFQFYSLIAKKLFQKSDCIICCSDYEAKIIKKSFSNISQTHIVPLGVDFSRFKYNRKKTTDNKILMYSGRLEKYKGVQHIIKALYLLKKRNDLQLRIVGDGPFRRRLENLTKNLNLDDSVIFLGKKTLDETISLYYQSDIFVFPSLYESFGIVIIEALASGIKVLSTPVGESEFLIKKCLVSELKYPPNPGDLAEKISDSINNNTKRKNRPSFLKKYSYKNITKKLEDIYFGSW